MMIVEVLWAMAMEYCLYRKIIRLIRFGSSGNVQTKSTNQIFGASRNKFRKRTIVACGILHSKDGMRGKDGRFVHDRVDR